MGVSSLKEKSFQGHKALTPNFLDVFRQYIKCRDIEKKLMCEVSTWHQPEIQSLPPSDVKVLSTLARSVNHRGKHSPFHD